MNGWLNRHLLGDQDSRQLLVAIIAIASCIVLVVAVDLVRKSLRSKKKG